MRGHLPCREVCLDAGTCWQPDVICLMLCNIASTMTEYHFAGFSFNAAGRDEEAPVLDSKVNWEIVQRPVKEK